MEERENLVDRTHACGEFQAGGDYFRENADVDAYSICDAHAHDYGAERSVREYRSRRDSRIYGLCLYLILFSAHNLLYFLYYVHRSLFFLNFS
jgi:hypothetical protein